MMNDAADDAALAEATAATERSSEAFQHDFEAFWEKDQAAGPLRTAFQVRQLDQCKYTGESYEHFCSSIYVYISEKRRASGHTRFLDALWCYILFSSELKSSACYRTLR